MEENKETVVQKITIKPFLGIFIILFILLSGYYFVWRSIAFKMKDVVTEYLNDYKYDSISISGFPFLKTVKIENLNFTNNVFLASKNSVNIKQVKISSVIFGSELNIKLKDITNVNKANNETYSLNYSEDPTIKLNLYSDGNLKSFYYSDNGYRVVNIENKTIYTSDKSFIDVKSVRYDNTIDYSTNGDFVGMQNISLLETKNNVAENSVPEIYNLKLSLETSITETNNKIEKSTIKINNVNFTSDKGSGFSINGKIFKESDDQYSFGELKLVINNYVTFLENYKKDVINALTIENESSSISKDEQNQYVQISNTIFEMAQKLIAKNQETTENKGVIVINRQKNTPDYTINGESLFGIIQNLISSK